MFSLLSFLRTLLGIRSFPLRTLPPAFLTILIALRTIVAGLFGRVLFPIALQALSDFGILFGERAREIRFLVS